VLESGNVVARMRILIADDQRIVREGLATILRLLPDMEVVGVAANGQEVIEMAAGLNPEVVLMDLRMPGIDGFEATRTIRAQWPHVQVVVLTTYADDETVLQALSAGAIGYLTKDAGGDAIYRAVSAAFAGQSVLDASVQQRLVEAARSRASRVRLPDGLTEREMEVLALMADGLSNADIASRLFVSMATVKTHVNRILSKTSCRNRKEVIAYAKRNGL